MQQSLRLVCASYGQRRAGQAAAAPLALLCHWRCVHERPYLELPHDPAKGEAYEVARDTLLQLNLMARRGIAPDALMYTSMINIMGRAGLEWQAYKLFSRMIEANVRPLPETYVALRDATARHRTKLRDDIQTKIEESVTAFPDELAETELARQREDDRQCVTKFEDYMRGELPPLPGPPTTVTPSPSQPHTDEPATSREGQESVAPVATMRIRSPADAWNVARHAEEVRGRPLQHASGEAAVSLAGSLRRLHEEELRIFLAANRQLRHGEKEELIARVLETVSEQAIHAMLARRNHYFRSVEQVLAADLEVLRSSPADAQTAGEEQREERTRHVGEADRTLAEAESNMTAPEMLLTPWGLIRKPLRHRVDRSLANFSAQAGASSHAQRLERVRLSAPELLLVRQKAESNDLDELPESLLRRYAFQFRLHWRRREAMSLLNAVSWHATTLLASEEALAEGTKPDSLPSPDPTPAIRLLKEREGMQRTLENFEAFRIISQRTNNLQVVDDKEINLHLKRLRREDLQRERKTENSLRREKNRLAAAGLAAAARSYDAPPEEPEEAAGTHVLGWETAPADSPPATLLDGGGGAAAGPAAEELPPWALGSGEHEFNMTTGRFGDPREGHYQELSDSRVRLLPSREAQTRWTVDEHLLPGDLRDVVENTQLEQLQYHQSVEGEYKRRRQYAKYRRWDNMIQKADSRKRHERAAEEEDGAASSMRPLPAKKRLAQLLKQGAAKQRVSNAVLEKYNKPL